MSCVSGIKALAGALQHKIKDKVQDVRETIKSRFSRKSNKKYTKLTATESKPRAAKVKHAKPKPARAETVRQVVPKNHAADRKWAALKQKEILEAPKKDLERSNHTARNVAADQRIQPEPQPEQKIPQQNTRKNPKQDPKNYLTKKNFYSHRESPAGNEVSIKSKEAAIGPLHLQRRLRPKRDVGYYWPRGAPCSSSNQRSSNQNSKDASHPLCPLIPIPKIIITPPPIDAPSPPSTSEQQHHSSITPNPALLTPPATTRNRQSRRQKSPTPNHKPIQKSKTNKAKIAPKPSLFSYTLCTHPSCPIAYAHAPGTFKYGEKFGTYQQRKSAKIIFGECVPPPEVWDAWGRVKKRGVRRKDAEGNVEDCLIVVGFMEAHVRGV